MAWAKKNTTYTKVYIETLIFEILEAVYIDVGQTKTIAVELALSAYLDIYDKTQQRLKVLQARDQDIVVEESLIWPSK